MYREEEEEEESVMDGGKSGRNLLLLPVKRIRPRVPVYRGYALNS